MNKFKFIFVLAIFSLSFVSNSCLKVQEEETGNVSAVSNYTANISVEKKFEDYNYFSLSSDGKYFFPFNNEYWPVNNSQIDERSASIYKTENLEGYAGFYNTYFGTFTCNSAAISPDGTRAAMTGTCYNGFFGEGLVVWNFAYGSQNYFYENKKVGKMRQIEFSSTGDSLFFTYINNSKVFVLDFKTMKVSQIDEFSDNALDINFFKLSNNSQYIMINDYGNIIDLNKKTIKLFYNSPFYGNFFPDNKRAILCNNNKITIYDLANEKVLKVLADNSNVYYYNSAVCPNGKFFATEYSKYNSSANQTEYGVQIWESEANAKVASFKLGSMSGQYTYRNTLKMEFGASEEQLFVSLTSGITVLKIKYSNLNL